MGTTITIRSKAARERRSSVQCANWKMRGFGAAGGGRLCGAGWRPKELIEQRIRFGTEADADDSRSVRRGWATLDDRIRHALQRRPLPGGRGSSRLGAISSDAGQDAGCQRARGPGGRALRVTCLGRCRVCLSGRCMAVVSLRHPPGAQRGQHGSPRGPNSSSEMAKLQRWNQAGIRLESAGDKRVRRALVGCCVDGPLMPCPERQAPAGARLTRPRQRTAQHRWGVGRGRRVPHPQHLLPFLPSSSFASPSSLVSLTSSYTCPPQL